MRKNKERMMPLQNIYSLFEGSVFPSLLNHLPSPQPLLHLSTHHHIHSHSPPLPSPPSIYHSTPPPFPLPPLRFSLPPHIFISYILVEHLEECDAHRGVVMVVHVCLWSLHPTDVFCLSFHHLVHKLLHVILHLLLATVQNGPHPFNNEPHTHTLTTHRP